MNLDKEMFFDHHTHLLDPGKTELTPKALSMNFLHGYQDMDPFVQGLDAKYAHGRASETQLNNIENLGVVKTVVNYMSQYLHCEPSIGAVVEARNKLVKDESSLAEYTKCLYRDQHIIGTVVDWPNSVDEKSARAFPVPIYRLYNYEDVYFDLLLTASSFPELMAELAKNIRQAIADGFVALKCHLCEHYTMAVRPVSDEEAEKEFAAVPKEDRKNRENLYFATFRHLLFLCQELNVPIHIHTGSTGFNRKSACFVPEMDPFLLVPFIVSDPQYVKTKLIFLHQSYPYTRHAALMAYSFPNMYVDMSWVLPWSTSIFCTCIEDVLSTAPHTKIFFGSGQHGIPEIAWTAAKVAKSCLASVLERMVSLNLLAATQAEKIAKMLLYENAKALYRIKADAVSL
jgi:predicted TIM-barrel fold metal-dependent hydrolase